MVLYKVPLSRNKYVKSVKFLCCIDLSSSVFFLRTTNMIFSTILETLKKTKYTKLKLKDDANNSKNINFIDKREVNLNSTFWKKSLSKVSRNPSMSKFYS